MTDRPAEATADEVTTARGRGASVTRGFLFADLRDYTAFVETHGAVAAVDLLARYRAAVRTAIERFSGAEIRTEGDSFYVVFQSVSDAVECGLAIVADADQLTRERPELPVRVGIGVHAGETVETPEGYVGSPVNVAARLCARAAAGEVLVSDTVRALTQTVLPVRFESRGRRALKGVAEPIAIYRVVPASSPAAVVDRHRRALIAGLAGVVALGVAAAGLGGWAVLNPHTGLPPGSWKLAVDLPLTGDNQFRGQPILDAIQMALDDGRKALAGTSLALADFDDNGGEPQDPNKGATNARSLVADPQVLALVGPTSSRVGLAQVPITNQAGLLQCSPATTNPALTKPAAGALDLRSAAPDRINFVRLATTDDQQGPAAASLAFRDLQATNALVVDDTTDFGRDITKSFATRFLQLGGRVTTRGMNTDASDVESAIAPLQGRTGSWVVYFGGSTYTGAPQLRKAMVAHGWLDVPLIGSDGIVDGSGMDKDSYIQAAGMSADRSYATSVSVAPFRHDFADQYQLRFGQAPDEFSAAGYACTQVILQSLLAVAPRGPSATELREAVRAWAVAPTHRFDTVLGSVGFDSNGDTLQQFVTFYRVDPSAANGTGDWVIDKEQDFGPAP